MTHIEVLERPIGDKIIAMCSRTVVVQRVLNKFFLWSTRTAAEAVDGKQRPSLKQPNELFNVRVAFSLTSPLQTCRPVGRRVGQIARLYGGHLKPLCALRPSSGGKDVDRNVELALTY